ncbi:hypothetical protein AOLI_G00080350 [Acnodon oligacanthus]
MQDVPCPFLYVWSPASLGPSALSGLPRDELVAVVKTRLHNYRCYTAHSKLHSWSLSFPSSEPTLPSHPVSSVHCLQLQHPSMHLRLVRSSDRMRSGGAELGSRLTGAEELNTPI